MILQLINIVPCLTILFSNVSEISSNCKYTILRWEIRCRKILPFCDFSSFVNSKASLRENLILKGSSVLYVIIKAFLNQVFEEKNSQKWRSENYKKLFFCFHSSNYNPTTSVAIYKNTKTCLLVWSLEYFEIFKCI